MSVRWASPPRSPPTRCSSSRRRRSPSRRPWSPASSARRSWRGTIPVVKYTPSFVLGDPVRHTERHGRRPVLAPERVARPRRRLSPVPRLRPRLRPVAPAPRAVVAFRDNYAYTNFGLTAAALAAAKAAGTDWEDLSDQVLYEPLGMTSTSSRFADYEKAANKALTHVKIGGKWVAKYTFDDDAASPAGGVSSTARDLTKWMRLQLAERRVRRQAGHRRRRAGADAPSHERVSPAPGGRGPNRFLRSRLERRLRRARPPHAEPFR